MRIPIRSKLAGALALPLAALVGVAGYEVARADRQSDEAAAETELATAAVGPGSLISQLQLERNFAGVDLLGLTGALELPVSSYEEARTGTDQAREELEAFVAGRGGDVAAAFDSGLAAVSELEEIRADIDSSTLERGIGNATFANEIFDRYTAMIDVLLDDTAGVALRVDRAELRTGVELVDLATRSYEVRALIVKGIILPTLTGDTSLTPRTDVSALLAEAHGMDEQLLARSVGAYEGLPETAVGTPRVVDQDRLFSEYVATGAADITALAAQVSSTGEEGYVRMRQEVAAALDGEASAVLADAEDHRQLVVTGAAIVIGLALLFTLLASRSITKPLRSLTRQAREMAADRLPAAVQQVLDTPLGDDVVVPEVAPISVKTRDEVGDVAAALNTVQGSALDLAVEQAVLRRNIADSFVNLGRRNQNLLDRQLDFITDLERQEQEPERLEGLFRLDHLATRMRRNAESLLRLAGGGDSTSTGWSGPVPMVDVVRGALGEVEDYQRVDLRGLEPATVSGSAGADLAHALAELVENALAFSPPQERVEIRGRRDETGNYVVAVIDHGVGMSDEQLLVANRRLAGRESFTVAPSRYLGHYVAGHLATTHGIKIELQSAAAGGITARLEVPASLLTAAVPEVTAAPVTPPVAPPALVAPVEAPPAEVRRVQAVPTPLTPVLPLTHAAPPVEAPAPVAPVDPAPVAPVAPVTPVEAGFGGLPTRPEGSLTPPTSDPTVTPSGLTRRVRGAQAPTATSVAAAFGPPADGAEVQPTVTSADDVSSFLSAFSGGVERGLADAKNEEERW